MLFYLYEKSLVEYISLIDPLKSKNEFKNHKPHSKFNFNDVEKKILKLWLKSQNRVCEYQNIELESSESTFLASKISRINTQHVDFMNIPNNARAMLSRVLERPKSYY